MPRRAAITIRRAEVSDAGAIQATFASPSDNWLNYVRLELTVYTDNAVALRLYRKFGFEIEGTLKAFAFRNGRFIDAYTMARIAPASAGKVGAREDNVTKNKRKRRS